MIASQKLAIKNMKWYFVLLIAVGALLIGMWIANARNKKKAGNGTVAATTGTGSTAGTTTGTGTGTGTTMMMAV